MIKLFPIFLIDGASEKYTAYQRKSTSPIQSKPLIAVCVDWYYGRADWEGSTPVTDIWIGVIVFSTEMYSILATNPVTLCSLECIFSYLVVLTEKF